MTRDAAQGGANWIMTEFRSPENALEEKKSGRAERGTENSTTTKIRCSETTITRAFALSNDAVLSRILAPVLSGDEMTRDAAQEGAN